MSSFDTAHVLNRYGVYAASGTFIGQTTRRGTKQNLLTINESVDRWGNLYVPATGPWEMQSGTAISGETVAQDLGTISTNYVSTAGAPMTSFASQGCTGYYAGVLSGTGTLTIQGGTQTIGGVSYTGGGKIIYTNTNTLSGATTVQTGADFSLGIDTTSTTGTLASSAVTVQTGGVMNFNSAGAVYPGKNMTNGFNNSGTINVSSVASPNMVNLTNGTSTNNASGVINLITGVTTIDSAIANNGTINLAAGTTMPTFTGTISGSGDIVSNGGDMVAVGATTSFSFSAPTQKLIVNSSMKWGYRNGIPTNGTPVFNWYAGIEVNAPLNIYGANAASGIFSDIRPNVGGATFTGSGDINLMAGYVCWGQAGGATAAAATYNGTINVKSGARMDLRNFAGAAAVGNFPTRNATVNIESGGLVAVVSSNGYAEIGSLSGAAGGTLQINSSGLVLVNQNPATIVRSVITGAVALTVFSPGTLNTEAVNTLTGSTTVGGNAPGAGIGGGYATTGAVGPLIMGGAASRLVVNPISTSSASKLTCTNFSATANAYKVDITGPMDAGTYPILTATGSKNLNLPTVGTNASGRTASFAWSGNNLNMTLA